MSLNDQRNFVEELFRITELTQKAILLKEEIKQTENSIEIEKAIIKEKEIQNQARARRISEAETRIVRWEEDKESKLAIIAKQLARIENVDFAAESEKISKLKEQQAALKSYDSTMRDISKTRINLESQLGNKQNEYSHLSDAKCPYCLQAFADAGKKIEEISVEIDSIKASIEENNMLSSALKDEISNTEYLIKELSESIKHPDLSDLIKIKSQADASKIQKAELESAANPHVEAYDALVSENQDDSIDTKKLDGLYVTLEHQKFLLKLLTDKNSFIRKAIISKSIPFLNNRIAIYTKELLLPHTVTFEPDMSCTITEYGRELDHGNLSAGESKRLNLALSLAFRDVLTHLHSKVNLLLCDEIDGGSLCIPTTNSLIHLLKAKSRDDEVGIWCISHSTEFDGRLDNVMVIRKENGFSYVADD
jgi:hypothetical protein